jgi:hypothetical protein
VVRGPLPDARTVYLATPLSPTGSDGALMDLVGLLHLLGSKSKIWRSVKGWPDSDSTRAVYPLERLSSSKVATSSVDRPPPTACNCHSRRGTSVGHALSSYGVAESYQAITASTYNVLRWRSYQYLTDSKRTNVS